MHKERWTHPFSFAINYLVAAKEAYEAGDQDKATIYYRNFQDYFALIPGDLLEDMLVATFSDEDIDYLMDAVDTLSEVIKPPDYDWYKKKKLEYIWGIPETFLVEGGEEAEKDRNKRIRLMIMLREAEPIWDKMDLTARERVLSMLPQENIIPLYLARSSFKNLPKRIKFKVAEWLTGS